MEKILNTLYINLGEYETLLKRLDNISRNHSLYILEIIYGEEGMKV